MTSKSITTESATISRRSAQEEMGQIWLFSHIYSPRRKTKLHLECKKSIPVFNVISTYIAKSYHVFDSCSQIRLRRNVWGKYRFLWFLPKFCFCYSGTAASVPDRTDPAFGSAMVAGTPDCLEYVLSYVRHSATPF